MDLPVWASTLITAAISTIITTVISLTVKWSIQKHLDKKDEQMEQLEQYKHDQRKKERQQEMTEIVKASIEPVIKRIDEVDDKVTIIQSDRKLEREATTVTMRVKMMELRDVYVKRGYCDSHEKATWDELYHRYKNLGGNHFLEYVDQYKEEIHNLPDKLPEKTKKKESKK